MDGTYFLLISLLVLAGMVVLPIFTGAPWHPLMPKTIKRILNFADIRPGETLCDLGCGEGRVLITAAKDYSAKGIGVESYQSGCGTVACEMEKGRHSSKNYAWQFL